ncbi:disulfide oxidoreductase [Bacillaceae bacterium W0354]
MNKRTENLMVFTWVVALVATLGSLYFSEIKNFEPCKLCWIQRIFMYPIVIIILIGMIIKDKKAMIYTAVFSGIGFLISSYHYAIQKLPFLQDSAPSCGRVTCTGAYVNWLGFVTIPFLAGTAFLIIFITSILIWRRN